MDKKTPPFSTEDIMRIANSPTGQQLLAMLKQADSATLQQAAAQANAGQYDAAQNTMQALLSDPKMQALIRQLGGK